MHLSKTLRTLGAVAFLAGVPLISASAQTQSPPTTSPSPPTATKPTAPKTSPGEAGNKVNPLIGLAVFSSDGSKVGTVSSVNAEPDGKVKAVHFRTGGFLGFGAKLVAVPEGKFTRSGENVQLGITADEVSKLPEVKEQS
jgi:sporulation protein YlmC with PRC-barrel domain